ncbi:hypothetical protein JTB14_023501 [Gonioctena quinquepunctata]|nr:hypothetical protein JTB14_023501 [Gonioctena quinquepunctata]
MSQGDNEDPDIELSQNERQYLLPSAMLFETKKTDDYESHPPSELSLRPESVLGEAAGSEEPPPKDPVNDNFEANILSEEEIATEVCRLAGNPNLCKLVKAALRMQPLSQVKNKTHVDISSLPARQYLDETVVPILMNAFTFLVEERPPEPITALAVFLLKNKSLYEMAEK